MNRTLKVVLSVISILAVVVCICCGLYIFQYFRGNMVHSSTEEIVRSETVMTIRPGRNEQAEETAPVGNAEETHTPEASDVPAIEEKTSVFSVIDFDALWEINAEIYAWIEVPGTNISYAVVQSASNDLYYHNHNIDRSYFSGGSIYSQRYTSKDFMDSVSVIYGHNMQSGTMFTQVNNFRDVDFFEANRYIYIYTPETLFIYEIFAAYPHSNEHLLLCHDFSDESEFTAYFNNLSAAADANYRRDSFPEYGDKVITLSTCYRPDRQQRYLLQGILVKQYNITESSEEVYYERN